MLKPQDVLVLLKLLAKGEEPWAQGKLALELGMSASEVNAGLKRLEQSGLVLRKGVRALAAGGGKSGREQISIVVAREATREFLLYALKYLFPAKRGEPTRGMPAAYAAGDFPKKLSAGELPPVWPDPAGDVRGFAFKPLYPCVPFAAKQDKKLYDLLAIADVLRSGNARDIKVAKDLLNKELDG